MHPPFLNHRPKGLFSLIQRLPLNSLSSHYLSFKIHQTPIILVIIFTISHYFSNISLTLYLLQILSRNHPIRNYWHKSSFRHQCKIECHHTKVKILILASEHIYKLFYYRDPLHLLFTFLCQMTLIHMTLCPPLFSLIRTSYAITDLSFFNQRTSPCWSSQLIEMGLRK